MNDYFDAFEQELKAAVPRAARSHRRRRNMARLPLFRLNSLWFLLLVPIAIFLSPPAGLSEGSTHVAPHHHVSPAGAARKQVKHKRAPRRPDELTLLKGLDALRRHANITPQAEARQTKIRVATPVPIMSVVRFAAATAALGAQAVLVSSRRPSPRHPPGPAATRASDLIPKDRHACSIRTHAEDSTVRRLRANTTSDTNWFFTSSTRDRHDHARRKHRPAPGIRQAGPTPHLRVTGRISVSRRLPERTDVARS